MNEGEEEEEDRRSGMAERKTEEDGWMKVDGG
jgi:hypothetical protein